MRTFLMLVLALLGYGYVTKQRRQLNRMIVNYAARTTGLACRTTRKPHARPDALSA